MAVKSERYLDFERWCDENGLKIHLYEYWQQFCAETGISETADEHDYALAVQYRELTADLCGAHKIDTKFAYQMLTKFHNFEVVENVKVVHDDEKVIFEFKNPISAGGESNG